MKLVVVEPDEDVGELVATILGPQHDVRCFGRAGDALRGLADDSAHIVLAELDLPDMNGEDLARAIKDFDSGIRIVLTSNDWFWLSEVAGRGYAVLRKPFSLSQLWAQLRVPDAPDEDDPT
jgi:DNA-binding response OmpR family regulator